MNQIILDMGSGNTCGNSADYARRMIDAVVSIDKKRHEVIFKWQLEKDDPPGQKKLEPSVFADAYYYAKERGYKTTASVFDIESLRTLLNFEVPFIKIACRPDLYWLGGEVPRKIPVYLSSTAKANYVIYMPVQIMICVPEYPAKLEDYPPGFNSYSDHAPGLQLWNRYPPYHPEIWEKHFVLERSPANPDSGTFAITPPELEEVIG
jgi:sialic acid synthase SpsE